MAKAKHPSYSELIKTFELRSGFRLYRKEHVGKDGRRCPGRFVENVANSGHDYCQVRFKGRLVRYHVIVLMLYEGKDARPGYVINHIDNNSLNNHPKNLEWVTQRENTQKMRTHNEGRGFPGVTWHKARGKWSARGWGSGKRRHIGRYRTQLEAIDAVIQFHVERNYPVDHLLELRAKFVDGVQVVAKRA